jgi:signal transduction histidine kinase/DNA-binding response OmpR family regulator
MRNTGQQRILYIEDRLQAARLVQAKLQQYGYIVDLAHDSAGGLAMLETQSYQLILLDPHITQPDGLSLLPTLTARTPALPILLIEEEPDVQMAALAIRLGVGDYLYQGRLDEHLQLLPLIVERTLERCHAQQASEVALEELRQNNRNLLLLTRAAHLLTSSLDMKRVMPQLMQTITEIVVTEGSSVWLWDKEHEGHLLCTAMYLDGRDITSNRWRLPSGNGIVGWVATHAETVNVIDAADDERFSPAIDQQTGYRTRSILAVPLITRSEVIGVLEFVNKMEGDFNECDRELAETLAAYAANAIENARLMESVSQHRDALEAQNEALDAFAHSVAHDLKNPLTLIVGYADMLRDGFSGFSDDIIYESLNTIVEYGIKMSNIVDALLLLASVGTGNDIETETVDMDLIAREVLKRMDHMVREYKATVILPETWPPALGYGPWLEEVWYNYLSNGIKYGGRPPHLELGCHRLENDTLCFWVKDNGPGMQVENPKALFLPQARKRRQRDQNGHGLGLSIVQRIIERLGGEVGVESQPGAGSTFYFTLPAAKVTNKE